MTDSVNMSPKHQPLDEETSAALTLYNTYLIADREQQARERALKKAGKAKDEAAATVRRLNDDKAPAAETAEAEAAYREAVEALRHLREGDQAAPQDTSNETQDAGEKAVDEQEAPAADTEQTAETGDETPAETQEAPAKQEPATGTGDEDRGVEDQPESVGVEASVGDDDLAGDEPAGVTG